MQFLPERVAQARKARGWTQSELARKARVSFGYIHSLENGRIAEPREALDKVASAIGIPRAHFYDLSDVMPLAADGDLELGELVQRAEELRAIDPGAIARVIAYARYLQYEQAQENAPKPGPAPRAEVEQPALDGGFGREPAPA